MNKAWHKVVIPSVLVVIAVIGFVVYSTNSGNNHKQTQAVLSQYKFFLFDQPRSVSGVTLNNLAGEEKAFIDHSSGWRIVNFGYMFCPDICPINLALLSDVKTAWDKDIQAGKLQKPLSVVHVTFDPERDTPDVLKSYLDYMNPSFYGLTGAVESIRRLAQQLNMVFIHEKPDEHGNYFITHSDSMALVNPEGQYVGMFKGPYQQENMLKVLGVLIENKAIN